MRLLILFGLLSLGANAQNQQAQPVPLKSRMIPAINGGLNSYRSGNRLNDNESQVASNIFWDKDEGAFKRGGQAIYSNIAGCSSAVRSAGVLDAPNGKSYSFVACGGNAYVNPGTGYYSVIGGTINATANVYFRPGLGQIWVTDGVDALWSSDGVHVSSHAASPIAQLDGVFQGRLVLANINGGESTIELSGYNNGSDFTLPAVILDTSPAIFGLNGLNDGRKVTCVFDGFRDVLIIWNHDEMYGLYGSGNSSFILRKLSEIGCDEQESVQEFNGNLKWLSKYGIYNYDGATTVRVSDPIKDQILNIINTEPGYLSVTQNQQSDWIGGNLNYSGPGASLSATISPGNVVPDTFSFIDSFNSPYLFSGISSATISGVATESLILSSGTAPLSNSATMSNYDFSGALTWSGGILQANPTGSGEMYTSTSTISYGIWTATMSVHYTAKMEWAFISDNTYLGTTHGYAVEISGNGPGGFILRLFKINANGGGGGAGTLLASTNFTQGSGTATCGLTITRDFSGNFTVTTANVNDSNCSSAPSLSATDNTYYLTTYNNFYLKSVDYATSISAITLPFDSYTPSGLYQSPIIDVGFSTPIAGNFSVNITSPTGTNLLFAIRSSNNSSPTGNWTSWTALSPNSQPAVTQEFWQYESSFTTTVATQTPTSSQPTLIAGDTGYFATSCIPINPIISWGIFQSNYISGNGSVSFAVSTGTSCNSVIVGTAVWTAQSINSTISVATAPYLGVRILLSGYSEFDPLNQPTLQSVTANWNSAIGRPRTASQVFDNRYWLAFTTAANSSAYNNSVLILDEQGRWSNLSSINASSLFTYNRLLYSGSSLGDGNVNVQNTGSTDFGSPVVFDFQSPDYEIGDFNTVDLYDLSIEAMADTSATPNINYYLDGSTVPYSLGNMTMNRGTPGLIYYTGRFGQGNAPSRVHTVRYEIIDNSLSQLIFYRSLIRYTPQDGP